MSEKIEVIRLKPCELSRGQIFRLNYLHNTELGDFVVLKGEKERKLFVNERVPEEDIQKFLRICCYEGEAICDDGCPISDVLDHVYEKYGYEVWSALVDIYKNRRDERKKMEAKTVAQNCFRAIDEYRFNDDAEMTFADLEYLVYELSRLTGSTSRKTCHNLVGIGEEYVFYLGYLMGTGKLNLKEAQGCNSIMTK